MTAFGKLLQGLEKKYKAYSLLTPVTMIGEVVMEVFIPLLMSKIIDVGIAQGNLPYVLTTGLFMVGLACVSLVCGSLGARFGAVASLGFPVTFAAAFLSRFRIFHSAMWIIFLHLRWSPALLPMSQTFKTHTR